MGIQDDLQELKKMIKESEQKKEEKKFKFPFGKKVGKRQAKKNFITVIKINENSNIDFKKVQIDEQTIMEGGIPRLAASKYVMHWKGKPVIILPSWSVEPFSPKDNYEQSLVNGSNAKGYAILMNKMIKETADGKKKVNGGMVGWIVGGILLLVIGYALMTGGAA